MRVLMDSVSRDILRAVLETRDHRHNETHAILLTMFQSLVTEMIEQGALAPGPLAARLSMGRAAIEPDPHGKLARSMLDHVVDWLHTMQPGLPPSHPERWVAPSVLVPDEE
jgi:hypothetical protein